MIDTGTPEVIMIDRDERSNIQVVASAQPKAEFNEEIALCGSTSAA